MAVTTKVPLGASTLNRKWYLDVNTGTHAEPVWTGVFGILDFKPGKDPTLQDDSDFDGGGYKSSTVTALGWALEFKVARKVLASSATSYDVGQEALRSASDGMGTANQVEVRWYEVTTSGPAIEAYSGYAAVSWVPDGGAMDALDTVTVTLTGKGQRTAITHPSTAAKPTLTSLSPATCVEAGGVLVLITGTGFTGTVTDGVKFDATAAEFYVLNDCQILAVAPADSAGTVAVSVENATGVSTDNENFIYTVA